MKTLIVSFVFLGFVIFFGCQNSITDPVSPETTNYSGVTDDENVFSKDWLSVKYPFYIKLEGILLDPGHVVHHNALISGILRYNVREVSKASAEGIVSISKNAPTDIPTIDIKVDFYLKAKIKAVTTTGCGGFWTATRFDDSIVRRSASSEPLYFIEKSFRIENASCVPLKLVLKFELRNKNLKLVSQTIQRVPEIEPMVVYQ